MHTYYPILRHKSAFGSLSFLVLFVLLTYGCNSLKENTPTSGNDELYLQQDTISGTISVFHQGVSKPLVTQNAKPEFRPYLHPIAAPDGKGILTEVSPEHHKYQTGLYWGFTRVNGGQISQDSVHKWFYRPDKPTAIKDSLGRDFFHNPGEGYWKRITAEIIEGKGQEVSWQTIYDMLDETGNSILRETQIWSMKEEDGKFLLDLEWQGKALTDITIGEFDYSGLFLRMPWKEGIAGQVVNAARQRNEKAEGQHAYWIDAGMQVDGREDLAHITVFDHTENNEFPQIWRVDNQMGIGSARSQKGDWHIRQGETETIKHQVVVYTGELNDIALTELWKTYVGNNSMYSTANLWRIAQEEGRKAKFLKPEEAAASMTLQEGFKVNAWAAEPMITQPIAFCWDDKGRMWIAENRDYETRGTGFSNSGDSRILILEDTNGDGTADSRKVFLEGIPFPSAIAVGFDGLFLGAPPNLLFVPDRNKDDIADVDNIEIRLTGWGIRDRHETINSLHWGPDGWLYGLEGFATPSKIRKPSEKSRLYAHKEEFPEDILDAEGVDINGGVWRYHPTKERFEVVAHGFSNPWGIDYDATGQLFISACVIPHLFHVIPGGIYHRQGGQHFNPYIYQDIQTIVDHRHRSAHGGARIYQSDAFPEIHKNRLFMANIHEHAVLSDILKPKGSGFVASHGDEFLMANNAQWIGFSMEIGPEGGLYVLDWHDADICGQEVLNKETGRVFRIVPQDSHAEQWEGRYEDLNNLTDEQLALLQTSESDWHARRARIILQYRAIKGKISQQALNQLKKIFASNKNTAYRLRAMWTLHVVKGFSEQDLINTLEDDQEYIRGWAIQLLCEDLKPSSKALAIFKDMALKDLSPVVHLYLAAALQRIPEQEAQWKIIEGLLSHETNIDDQNIPKMIWFGLEPLVANNSDLALDQAGKSNIPMISEFVARRLVDEDELEELTAFIHTKPKMLLSLLKGMQSGLEGRSDAKPPVNWTEVYTELKSDKATATIALQIAQQFGDAEAAQQYLTTLKQTNAPLSKRRIALEGLVKQQRNELIGILPGLLDESELRIDAIRAIASFDHRPLGELLMSKYASFNAQEKTETVQTLSTRSSYGKLVVNALKKGEIPKGDIPAYVARQLRRVVGNGFVEVWGPIDQLSGNKAATFKKYKRILTSEALSKADARKGLDIFKRTCGACHKLYGEGGTIGPEITGANRSNIDYLLNNIVDPSGEIQDDYKMVVITSQDGRTYSGNVAAENERQLTLRVIGQGQVIINKSDIQSREETTSSIMPEGLLETMTEQEMLDLMAYLQTKEQVGF
ncbi:PVC-type heme-binding CxxCH protein [Reichenbachiella sp. MALMAid0571]|uniref:PVC-type heme-binding CxxCH protein n=1 Tax=Reichenbachiella sp. MALMAid0571 TaxID=3143939 RepID=UPI0032DF64A7